MNWCSGSRKEDRVNYEITEGREADNHDKNYESGKNSLAAFLGRWFARLASRNVHLGDLERLVCWRSHCRWSQRHVCRSGSLRNVRFRSGTARINRLHIRCHRTHIHIGDGGFYDRRLAFSCTYLLTRSLAGKKIIVCHCFYYSTERLGKLWITKIPTKVGVFNRCLLAICLFER